MLDYESSKSDEDYDPLMVPPGEMEGHHPLQVTALRTASCVSLNALGWHNVASFLRILSRAVLCRPAAYLPETQTQVHVKAV